MWLFFLMCGVSVLAGVGHDFASAWAVAGGFNGAYHGDNHKIMVVIDLLYVFFGLIPLVAYLFCYFFFLYRMWEEVPRQFARTEPGIAAGLSLVPVFSFYWMFVALGGLYDDMNKAMQSYGLEKRFNATLMITACIVWLVIFFFHVLLLAVTSIFASMRVEFAVILMHVVSIIVALSEYVFTCVIFWIMRRNVLQFIDVKTEYEKAVS